MDKEKLLKRLQSEKDRFFDEAHYFLNHGSRQNYDYAHGIAHGFVRAIAIIEELEKEGE